MGEVGWNGSANDQVGVSGHLRGLGLGELGLDLEGDLVADEDAAGLERGGAGLLPPQVRAFIETLVAWAPRLGGELAARRRPAARRGFRHARGRTDTRSRTAGPRA